MISESYYAEQKLKHMTARSSFIILTDAGQLVYGKKRTVLGAWYYCVAAIRRVYAQHLLSDGRVHLIEVCSVPCALRNLRVVK